MMFALKLMIFALKMINFTGERRRGGAASDRGQLQEEGTAWCCALVEGAVKRRRNDRRYEDRWQKSSW